MSRTGIRLKHQLGLAEFPSAPWDAWLNPNHPLMPADMHFDVKPTANGDSSCRAGLV